MKSGLLRTTWVKAALLPAMALWQVGLGQQSLARHLRVERTVHVPAGSDGPACAVLDGDVYAHAASESLNDLRLFAAGGVEMPFALTESNTEQAESDRASVSHVSAHAASLDFDLAMPKRPYTAVDLDLAAKNFVGSAIVTAREATGREVPLGEFAIFDLSAQRLARSTTLALQESTFAQLHVVLHLHAAPGTGPQAFGIGLVRGAWVPPSRAAQTVYTVVAGTSIWSSRGQESVATLRLRAHAPVARVRVELEPGYEGNFLRPLVIAARPVRKQPLVADGSDVDVVHGDIWKVSIPAGESVGGDTSRSPAISARQLEIDAVLAANLRSEAIVEVSVQNGAERPLPLRSVQLEMRERRICFAASSGAGGYTLMYGDEDMPAAVYGYSHAFRASDKVLRATLGPERANPDLAPRADVLPFAERHADLRWLALLAVLAAGGGVALRGVRHRRGSWR